ncbi:MAG: Ig-like domain-containing protein [Alphaproteobacteria bacterium]|nr:Ig-like domain-containing protein [Alphaproteobacteria bacterium]
MNGDTASDSSDYYVKSITYSVTSEGAGGNDTLDGGSGSDHIYAEAGSDMVKYAMSENVGEHDFADGGSGYDVLRLTLSSAEYNSAAVQADIVAFQSFLNANSNQNSATGQGAVFQFNAFDLSVRNFEGLQLDVIAPPNSAPTANADSLTATEDTQSVWAPSVLLGNDTDPNAGDTIRITAVGNAVGGTVALDGSGNVVFNPTANYSGSASFTYTIADSQGLTSTASVSVNVTPVADAPVVTTAAASGNEDTQISLNISAALTDSSETLSSIKISGVPTGATLSAGTNNGSGVWTLTQAQLSGLKITPPANSDVDFNLTVSATSTESNGATATTTAALAVTVNAVADAPTLAASAASGNEDTQIPLSISSALTDTDGSETLLITISGVPTGATLSAGTNNGSGVWTLTSAQLAGLKITPPANSDVDFSLTVTAKSTEAGGGTATTTATLNVVVNPVADAPTLAVTGASGSEDTQLPLSISSALTDTDGSETLSVTISGVPTGATLSAGTNNGDGTWTLALAQLAGLTITPPHNSDADFTLTVSATSTEAANGSNATTTASFTVTVDPVNDAPVAVNDSYTGLKDTLITISALSGVLVNDSDPSDAPGNTLSAQIVSGPAHGTITLSADGGFIYTPNAGYFGADHFTYQAVDDGSTANGGHDTSNVATANLFLDLPVGQTNAPPVALDSSVYGVQDEPVGGQVGATDADHALQDLTFAILTGPQQGTVAFNPDGSFFITWTTNNQEGAESTGIDSGIYGQRVLADGTLAGAEYHINTSIPNNQTLSVVHGLDNGGFVISWQTQVGVGNNAETIAARLFGDNVEGMRDLSSGVGNDIVTGSPLNDSINTAGGNDIINGRDGNDIIVGGPGADQMTGGAGADTFVWHSAQDGSYFNQLDAITDFCKSDGDKLDFSSFVTLNGGDIADFVQLTQVGNNTKVSVDIDGALNGQNFQAVVLLQNVTGLEVHEMKDENHLVVTL